MENESNLSKLFTCSGGSNYGLGAGTLLPADLDELNSALSLIFNCDR